MKTLNTHINKSIELAKKFAFNLRKDGARPVLQTALINEKYVMATDATRAIRITHHETIDTPYLHHYTNKTNGYDYSNYPSLDRLFPDRHDAISNAPLNVQEWIEAHEAGLVAAKEHDAKTITLKGNHLNVKPVYEKAVKGTKTDYSAIKKCKGYKDIRVDPSEQVSFNWMLSSSTGTETVSYNCQFMLDILKTVKNTKQKEVELCFYGSMRPMLFIAGDLEFLLLPIRTY